MAGFGLSLSLGDPREDSIRRVQEAEDRTKEDNGVMPKSSPASTSGRRGQTQGLHPSSGRQSHHPFPEDPSSGVCRGLLPLHPPYPQKSRATQPGSAWLTLSTSPTGACHQGPGIFSGLGRRGTNPIARPTRQDWHHLSCSSQQQSAPCPLWRAIPIPLLSLESNLSCFPVPTPAWGCLAQR